MQVNETLADGLRRELKVTVPAGDLGGQFSARLDDLKGKAKLKGFRPGKVPVSHLRKIYGRGIMNEIIQETVRDSSTKVMEERGWRPATRPQIETDGNLDRILSGDDDLVYTLSLELVPEIKHADFSKLKLVRQQAEVSDADVSDALQRFAESRRPFEAVSDATAAKEGDLVTINFEGLIDDEPFEGSKADGTKVILGSGRFLPGFEEKLVGAKKGAERTVKTAFPEEYPVAHLAGKQVVFAVELTQVETPGDVSLDDEFAKKLGMENLAAMRKAGEEQLTREFERVSREKLKRELFDLLDKAHAFELPPGMVADEFRSIWRSLGHEDAEGEPGSDDPLKAERTEYHAIAERRIRLGLLISDIGEKNNVDVTREELGRVIAEHASRYPGQEQQVFEHFQKNPDALARLRLPLFEEKVVDFLLELASVSVKTVSREELYRDVEENAPVKKAAGKVKKKPTAKKKTPVKEKSTKKKGR